MHHRDTGVVQFQPGTREQAGRGGQLVDSSGLVDGTADHQRITDLGGGKVDDPQNADRLLAGAGDDEVVEAAFDHPQKCVADQGFGTDRRRGEGGERAHRGVGVDATGGQAHPEVAVGDDADLTTPFQQGARLSGVGHDGRGLPDRGLGRAPDDRTHLVARRTQRLVDQS